MDLPTISMGSILNLQNENQKPNQTLENMNTPKKKKKTHRSEKETDRVTTELGEREKRREEIWRSESAD